MIAANDRRDQAAHPIDDFIWVRAVPNHVAQTNGVFPPSLGSGQRRRQGGGVRMNITDHQEAHGRVHPSRGERAGEKTTKL